MVTISQPSPSMRSVTRPTGSPYQRAMNPGSSCGRNTSPCATIVSARQRSVTCCFIQSASAGVTARRASADADAEPCIGVVEPDLTDRDVTLESRDLIVVDVLPDLAAEQIGRAH